MSFYLCFCDTSCDSKKEMNEGLEDDEVDVAPPKKRASSLLYDMMTYANSHDDANVSRFPSFLENDRFTIFQYRHNSIERRTSIDYESIDDDQRNFTCSSMLLQGPRFLSTIDYDELFPED